MVAVSLPEHQVQQLAIEAEGNAQAPVAIVGHRPVVEDRVRDLCADEAVPAPGMADIPEGHSGILLYPAGA